MKTISGFCALAAALILVAAANTIAAPVDDSILISAKRSHIFTNNFRSNSVQVTSEDGKVTLKGTVKDDFNRSLAEETVRNIPGVLEVDNQIEVSEKTPAANSDEWVAARTKSALMFHRNTGNVNVVSKNGVVTIRGTAPNEEQKSLITDYVRDVDGVVNVTNEMTIDTLADDAITAPNTALMDDLSITTNVKMTLAAHRSTKDLRTRVATKDGVVTLTGEAKDQAEKERLSRLVADISGVKSVNNQMTTPTSEKSSMN